MEELHFDKGLLNPTLLGKKKITIRHFHHRSHWFVKGVVIKGIFKDGLNILLEITHDTEIKPLHMLTDSEAKDDGYTNVAECIEGLKKCYLYIHSDSTMAIIRYEVFKVEGTPVVSLN